MKKLSACILSLLLVISAGFAKEKTMRITSDKLTTVKAVSKIADFRGMDVIENFLDLYIAKDSDSDDFAVFIKKSFEDGTSVQFAMVCLEGDLFSRSVYTEKGSNGFKEQCILQEYDKNVRFNDGGNNEYLNTLGLPLYTVIVMNLRNNIRNYLVKEYSLVLPETTAKNDANFRKVHDENVSEINERLNENENRPGTIEILNRVIQSNFKF